MSRYDANTDEQLVEEYLSGDAPALRALIERYHDPLMRFLFRLTGQRQMAEDVFQETFLQVHQSLGGFDTTRRFKPWIFTIAANKGRDALRRAGRRPAVSLSASVGSDDDSTSFVDLMEIEMPHASTRLEQQEQSRMVQRALDRLSPRLREVLLLSYFQKLSYAQLADMLDIPLGTVKSRLHSAVAAFAKSWQEEVEFSGGARGTSSGGSAPGESGNQGFGARSASGGEHA